MFSVLYTPQVDEHILPTEPWLTQEKADLVRSSASPNQEENRTKGKETLAAPSNEVAEKKRCKTNLSFKTKTDIDILDDGFKRKKYGKKMVNSSNPRCIYLITEFYCIDYNF